MKKKIFALPMLLLCMVFTLQSCLKDEVETEETITVYEPVYLTKEQVSNSISTVSPKTVETPGKIYVYGDYLLISEPKKGVHIINNSNPAAPQSVAFLNIPGNVDIAVKNNVLYADNYMDLVALDITDPANAKVTKRIENAIPGYFASGDKGYVVDYVEKKVSRKYKSEYIGRPDYIIEDMAVRSGGVATTASSPPSGGGSAPNATGKGGSMARFTIYANNLYVVDQSNLVQYDISTPSSPERGSIANIGWGIETIFPYKDMLFIGSETGMFVYSVADPTTPTYLTQFQHARSCDPVVVEGDYAYVTLRSGTRCQGFSNQLDVVNIKNINSPYLVKSYAMTNPHGLGIDNGTLFICDGSDGLKVYNANDPLKIAESMLGHYTGFEAYDVIPDNKVLILTGKNGIRQYDYSDPASLKLLSTIAVTNN